MSHSQHSRLSTSCFPKVHLIRVHQLLTKAAHISHGHQITNDITNMTGMLFNVQLHEPCNFLHCSLFA